MPAKLAGVQHIVCLHFWADEKQPLPCRDHAQTEAYQGVRIYYTFLRDNFYLDFLIDMALENGEIRGQLAVGRCQLLPGVRTHLGFAAEILLNPRSGRKSEH